MKKEKQVCSVTNSGKLKDLGINQTSLFYWKLNEIQTLVIAKDVKYNIEKFAPLSNQFYSAYTVAELVQMNGNISGIEFSDLKEKYYRCDIVSKTIEYYNSFADACASKLIDAIEDEFISVDDANKRLL